MPKHRSARSAPPTGPGYSGPDLRLGLTIAPCTGASPIPSAGVRVARPAGPAPGRPPGGRTPSRRSDERSPYGRPAPQAGQRVVVRYTVATSTTDYWLLLHGPDWLDRRVFGEAIRDAVAELRAIDLTYSPLRRDSLVSRLRRGEISTNAYPPLADIVARCDAMRAATDGWFDAWAVPGGFDPGGLLNGWAVARAAARLRAAGIEDYAVLGGADLTVRGTAPHGGPWRVAVHHPAHPQEAPALLELTQAAVGTSGLAGRRGRVVDPYTGEPARHRVAAAVVGPDPAVADGYATALVAAGPAGLAWFPTPDGYRAIFTA